MSALNERLRSRIVGQETVFANLDRARESGRMAHAYLILGAWGTGKTRTAIAFAQDLLAPADDPELAAAGKKVARLVHPDLHIIFPLLKDEEKDPSKKQAILDAYAADPHAPLEASPTARIGIDQIRQVREEVAKAQVEAPYKVIVIHAAGRLSEPAAQSSLKLIEEPPANTILLLCAEGTGEILPTIVSRCQRVTIRPLPGPEVAMRLEAEGTPSKEAPLIAALARGSLGRAFQLREGGVLGLRDRALELFLVDGATPGAIAQRVESVSRRWDVETARRSVELLLTWYHDVLCVRAGLRGDRIHQDRLPQLEQMAARLTPTEVRRRTAILEELIAEVEQRVNPLLALEAALTRIARGMEPAFSR
ncbi:MAG: hypothetical protein KDA27_00975 [Candidatus Eisenbacteria bacterium]|uniref:DNA polymerase III subunit delta' n=1 Tax=Eiseniibacteriota bacterium TaxID=2212470 RepID=A0A956N7U6_UNCEI|nr:hypothetical protein [Candidatus Eisenbacteria bacterium]MCB9462237.1 hypothetical protein [Candidatus Eisenbacteria bacterium]